MFNPQAAERLLNKGAELDPVYSKIVHNNLGLLYLNLRRYEDSIEQFESSIALDSMQLKVQSNRLFAIATSGLYSGEKYLEIACEASRYFKTSNVTWNRNSTKRIKSTKAIHVGFVSGDIKPSCCVFFVAPAFLNRWGKI